MTKARPLQPTMGKTEAAPDGVSALLHTIKKRIDALPAVKPKSLSEIDAWAHSAGISVPWPRAVIREKSVLLVPKDMKLQMPAAPTLTVAGSFLLGMRQNDNTPVDVFVTVDADAACGTSLMEDYVYFAARAYALARVADALTGLGNIEWRSFRGYALMPVLAVTAPGCATVIVRACPPADVRPTPFVAGVSDASIGVVGASQHPSLVRNGLILSEALAVAHLRLLHAEAGRVPALRGAARLVRRWAAARGYAAYGQHVSSFQLTLALLHVSRAEPALAKDDFALFRALIDWLARTDLTEKPVVVAATKEQSRAYLAAVSAIRTSNGAPAAYLIEPVVGANVLYDWSAETAAVLRHDAARSLALLAQGDVTRVFLPNEPALVVYDAAFWAQNMRWLPAPDVNAMHYASLAVPESARAKMLARKLRQGLNTRLLKRRGFHDLMVAAADFGSWALSSAAPTMATRYLLGFVLDRAEARRLLDRCMPQEDKRVFRAFWRDRSELRRFADGDVAEAVAWTDFGAGKESLIIPDIVSFVLQTHMGGAEAVGASQVVPEDSDEPHAELIVSFDRISSVLRSLPGLPLAIKRTELTGSHALRASLDVAQCRSCSGGPLRPFMPAVPVLLHLEASAKWPTDYYGVLYARRAFVAEIARGLTAHAGLAVAASEDYFDVMPYEACPYVFRCRIAHAEEARLMARQGMLALDLMLANDARPRHARAAAVLCATNSIYAPTCRLFRRWLGVHMYASALPSELSETIVASAFVANDPPATLAAAFCRVLDVIVRHDWATQAFSVCFSSSTDADWSPERTQAAFRPDISAMWIAPSYAAEDPDMLSPFRCRLHADDVRHMQRLASVSLSLFGEHIDGKRSDAAAVVFTPSHARFDAVLRVKPQLVNRIQAWANAPGAANIATQVADVAVDVAAGVAAAQRLVASLPGLDTFSVLFDEVLDAARKELLPCRLYADLECCAPENNGVVGVVFEDGAEKDAVLARLQSFFGECLNAKSA